jgi:hypothetical protein
MSPNPLTREAQFDQKFLQHCLADQYPYSCNLQAAGYVSAKHAASMGASVKEKVSDQLITIVDE